MAENTNRVVLLTVDESVHSEHAVAWAKSLIRPTDNVHLITVLAPPTDPAVTFGETGLLIAIEEKCLFATFLGIRNPTLHQR